MPKSEIEKRNRNVESISRISRWEKEILKTNLMIREEIETSRFQTFRGEIEKFTYHHSGTTKSVHKPRPMMFFSSFVSTKRCFPFVSTKKCFPSTLYWTNWRRRKAKIISKAGLSKKTWDLKYPRNKGDSDSDSGALVRILQLRSWYAIWLQVI